MTAEWDLEPESPDYRNQRNIEQANQKEGQRFAENELGGTDGRDRDLLESADLAFAHYGESRQGDDQHQGQAADHSRHKKPAATQSGVIPGPRLKFERGDGLNQLRRNAIDAVLLVVPGKAKRDLRDVAGGNQRSVRVGRIHDHLQRRGLALAQVARKPSIDLDAHCSLSLLDEIAELAGVSELALHVEVRAGREERDQLTALLAVIQIEHNCRDVTDFVGGRVSKDQHLNDGRDDQDKARPLVAEDLDEFLDQHLLQASQHMVSPLLQPLVEAACSQRRQHEREDGQGNQVGVKQCRGRAFEEYLLQDRDVIARRQYPRDPLQGNGHLLDRKQKTGEQKSRQEGDEQRDLAGGKLALCQHGDEESER